ncbi:CarD family transcriptional regulator [Edaphobacillus lindanitolerans]|uniref:Transcriptional regulator, CarD family n=1 Tax=Edaphobacillus lindanitolerans TaxID=550447 RepID=A0A1U7PS81_9BACI|nr:CarD family transcriptional regulator [Edaphobacillus lindanitolerans]SIT88741.1 transcriptional regulator, CarD family [Edaphobacillus lindanitolerans]
MFEIGDVVVYAKHGLCKITDICEKDLFGRTRTYYSLHPLDEPSLKISTPADGKKQKITKVMSRKEAEELLALFGQPGIEWIQDTRVRGRSYDSLVQSGSRKDIAMVANALITRQLTTDQKMYDQDRKTLSTIQNLLFHEIAMALDLTSEEVGNRINDQILAGQGV